MSIIDRHIGFKLLAALLTLLVFCFASPSREAFAAEPAKVSTPEELSRALADDAVDAITLTAPSVALSEGISATHSVVIVGAEGSSRLITGADAQFKIPEGVTVRFDNIELESTGGYAVSCYGRILFGENVTLSGDYGVLLNSGSEAISDGRAVNISSSLGRALGVNTGGGQVRLTNLTLSQGSGSSHLVYLHPSSGELLLGGGITISSNNSNAIMCPNNGSSCPNVTVADGAAVSIYAPGANNTGASSTGAAVDIALGSLTVGKSASVSFTGGECGVIASDIDICDGAKVNASTSVSASGGGSALFSYGMVNIGSGASVKVGAEQECAAGGIHAGEGLSVGNGSQLIIRCAATARDGIYSKEAISFGSDVSVSLRGGSNGIVTEHGIITGERCVFDMNGISKYGFKGSGTLIADKLLFGQNNTIDVDAGYCAVYSREAFETGAGSRVTLSAGNEAPALWIDAEASSPGYITIVGSNVTVTSSAGKNAVHNAGVYIVGALTAEQNSVFYVESNSDFGIMGLNGDINVSSGSSLYVRSGCGIYLNNGDVRVSSSGSLFAHGMADSAVRAENGVVNLGDGSHADIQGQRFGVEVLGEGSLRISGASSFDIRSLTDRAVFIDNGTLSIENVERVSVWERKDGVENADVWWKNAPDKLASWEITAKDSGVEQNFADRTQLAPFGMQTFRGGEPVDISSLDWYNAAWETYLYSRIGMYRSRPIARANTFNIPAGKSFSWWLYGETYDEGDVTFELCSSSGEGEFDLKPNGRFTYTAPAYTRGIQTFSFTITNSEGVASNPAEVKINVTASKPPIAYSSTFTTPKETPFIGQLELHDYDGAISSTVITKQPEHGSLALSSDGKFVYTPEQLFVGMDSFEYYGVDDYGDSSNTGYVTIIVSAESGLFASNDTYATDSGTEVNARLVLLSIKKQEENASPSDVPPEEEAMDYTGFKFVVTQRPQYGNFSISEEGLVTYTPFQDFAGSDMFRYYAITPDGQSTNEAIVTLAIIPSQRPIVDNSYYSCAKNLYCSGKITAADIDGTVRLFTLTSKPSHGELTFDDLTGEFRYVPEKDFLGSVSFTYTAMDDDGLVSREATVYIEVLSFIGSLRAAGRLVPAILAACGFLAGVVVITWLLIAAVRKRNKREKEELEEYYRTAQFY